MLGVDGLGAVWHLERVVADNERHRNEEPFRGTYMPLDALLFFGDAGNGQMFGHPITAEGEVLDSVFAWNPILDDRVFVAASVMEYLKRGADGSLKLWMR